MEKESFERFSIYARLFIFFHKMVTPHKYGLTICYIYLAVA